MPSRLLRLLRMVQGHCVKREARLCQPQLASATLKCHIALIRQCHRCKRGLRALQRVPPAAICRAISKGFTAGHASAGLKEAEHEKSDLFADCRHHGGLAWRLRPERQRSGCLGDRQSTIKAQPLERRRRCNAICLCLCFTGGATKASGQRSAEGQSVGHDCAGHREQAAPAASELTGPVQ